MLNQPITLITATPGGGKTLRSIHEGIELAKSGRKVFFYGVDGYSPDKVRELFDVDTYVLDDTWTLDRWKELESGSVIVVDEAHKFLPVRQPGKPPQWIQDLTEIRHYGIQLILITQDPRNVDSFVRRLVGEHLHLSRKAGFAGSMIRTFQGIAENTDDYTARQSSSQSPWLYDKKLYDTYKSASLHVIKPKIPKKILFALVVGVAVLLAIPFIIYKFNSMMGDEGEAKDLKNSNTSLLTPKGSDETKKPTWTTAAEFVKAHTPLVPTAPWSAPIYEGTAPTQIPQIYCIASGLEGDKDRRCNCYTEQVTKIENIPLFICEKAVKEGIYHPYKSPSYEGLAPAQSEASVDARSGSAALIPPDVPSQTILQGPKGKE